MNLNQAKKAIAICLKAGVTPCLHGPPAIGKTTGCKQIAETAGIEFRALTTNLLMLEHLTGIPFNQDGNMIFSRPANIPSAGKGILLIDEITDGALSIQKMLYSLILERECNGHKIGDGWKIVAAGNRPQDGSNSSMLPSALITRMVHLGIYCQVPDFNRVLPETCEVDTDNWIVWAVDNKIHPLIIAYIKSFPDDLYHFQATPRTWDMLSRVLNVYDTPCNILKAIACGTVGQDIGTKFHGFMSISNKIPSIETILFNPENAIIPDDKSVLHALSTALTYKAEHSNFGNIIKYARRLSQEIQLFLIESIVRKDETFRTVTEYIQWYNENKDILH